MKKIFAIGIPIVLVLTIVTIVLVRPAPDISTMREAVATTDTDTSTPQDETTSDDEVLTPPATVTPTDPAPVAPAQPAQEPVIAVQPGRYETYSESLVDDYQSTILFFYAAWCPECRGFDQAISADGVPDDTQILRVAYDDAQDLRQKYGVTIQSTFVRVNASGDKQTLWNGYGKDKSVATIIENTR